MALVVLSCWQWSLVKDPEATGTRSTGNAETNKGSSTLMNSTASLRSIDSIHNAPNVGSRITNHNNKLETLKNELVDLLSSLNRAHAPYITNDSLLMDRIERLQEIVAPQSQSQHPNMMNARGQPAIEAHSMKQCPPTKWMPTFHSRGELGSILHDLSMKIGVELGVQQGLYAVELLQQWKIADEYVMVDLWAHQDHYYDIANYKQAEHDRLKALALTNGEEMKRSGFLKKLVVCQNYTVECAKLFPDGYFDFIYVDARHDYKVRYMLAVSNSRCSQPCVQFRE